MSRSKILFNDTVSKKLAWCALITSLIAVTILFIKIPIPAIQGGYIHPADIFVYLGADLLGMPAALACGIGNAIADVISGSVVFCIPSMLIKAGMTIVSIFAFRAKGFFRVLFFLLSLVWMSLTYSAVYLILGYPLPALAVSLPADFIQGLFGLAVYLSCRTIIRKSIAHYL